MNVVKQLRKVGIDVTALPSRHSVYFENIYGTNPDDRTQRVLAKADPFTASQLREIDAEIYHLGSLLADDFSLEVIKELSLKGLIAVDSCISDRLDRQAGSLTIYPFPESQRTRNGSADRPFRSSRSRPAVA